MSKSEKGHGNQAGAVKYAFPAAFVRRFMDLYALAGRFKAANAAKIQVIYHGTLISLLAGKFKAANAAKIQAVGNGTLISLYDEAELFHAAFVFRAALHNVNPRGVNFRQFAVAVAENPQYSSAIRNGQSGRKSVFYSFPPELPLNIAIFANLPAYYPLSGDAEHSAANESEFCRMRGVVCPLIAIQENIADMT